MYIIISFNTTTGFNLKLSSDVSNKSKYQPRSQATLLN